jgi:hypothetical protein
MSAISPLAEMRAAIESLDARLKVLEKAWRTLEDGCRQMMEEDLQRQREGEPGE